MSSNVERKPKKKKSGLLIALLIILIVLLIAVGGLGWYSVSLKPDKGFTEDKIIVIPEKSTLTDIGKQLQGEGIIKNASAFKIFTKLNKVKPLQAGQYLIAKDMKLKDIITMFENGDIYTGDQIQFTYVEGKTMPWLAEKIAESTNNTVDDVYALLKNEEYLNRMIEKYWFVTDVVKNPEIYYSLEGYLFPDTYTLSSKDASVEEIFSVMLNKMDEVLSERKSAIEQSGYSVHQILTLASVVEGESMAVQDRSGVAGVFFNRLNEGMSLGSDITTYYAVRTDPHSRDLSGDDLNLENPYNTRGPGMEGILPIGPVCSVSLSALDGTLNPDTNDYLFFVSDKNGKLYFSQTNAEHENTVARLQEEGLWYTY